MLRSLLAIPALAIVALVSLPEARAGKERELPDKFSRSPFSLMSLSVGHPNDGWQVRAKRLRNTPQLHVRDSSQRKNYGHPALVLMLRRSATDLAKALPGSVMLVGDLSYKHGGPIAGHRSHQSGRDADIGFYVQNSKERAVESTRFIAFDSEGKARGGGKYVFDDRRNWLLVQSWARDERAGLSHIFVSNGLRQRLLAYANRSAEYRRYIPAARALLKQPEVGEAHDDHFHVRIACPKRQSEICRAESR